jgi:hypothetical protein
LKSFGASNLLFGSTSSDSKRYDIHILTYVHVYRDIFIIYICIYVHIYIYIYIYMYSSSTPTGSSNPSSKPHLSRGSKIISSSSKKRNRNIFQESKLDPSLFPLIDGWFSLIGILTYVFSYLHS